MSPLAKKIADLILERDNVSFAELARLPGFNGDFIMPIPEYDNIIMWGGMSEDATHAIEEIRTDGRFLLRPTAVLTYLIDGAALQIPLAKRIRQYKSPRWLPVVLCRRLRLV